MLGIWCYLYNPGNEWGIFLESSSYSLALQTGMSMQHRHDTAAFKGNAARVNSSEMKIANSTVMTPVKVTQAFK